MTRTILALLLTTMMLGFTASAAFAQNFAIVNKDPGNPALECRMLCGGTGPGDAQIATFFDANVREVLTQQGNGTLVLTCKMDVPDGLCGPFAKKAFQVTDADGATCTIDSDQSDIPATQADKVTAVLSPTGKSTLRCVKVIDNPSN